MVEMIIKPNLTKAFLLATWLLAAPLLPPLHASADTYTWSGNHTNANWDTNSYWSPSPGSGDWVGKTQANRDGAIIGIFSNITVYLNQDVYLSYLYLSKTTNTLLFQSDRIMRVEKTASAGDPYIYNSGTITLGANSSLLAYDGALVRLWYGGTLDLGASGTLGYAGTGAGSFISNNTVSGAGAIAAAFTNNGTLTASGGTLSLTNANFVNTGTINVNAGGIFNNSSGANVNLGSNVVMAGGELKTTSGSFSSSSLGGYGLISATLTNDGAITADNATALRIAGTVTNTSHVITTGGSGKVLEIDGTVSGGQVNPNSGTVNLAGLGTPTLTGTTLGAGVFNVQSDSIINGGTTLASGTQVNVGAGRILNLYSTITGGSVNPGSGAVNLQGATLNNTNLGAGTVNVQSNSSLTGAYTTAASLQVNNGTLTVAGTPTGSGNVSVSDSGKLDLKASFGAGAFSMAESALLQVAASNNLSLTGDFLFFQKDEAAWDYGGAPGVGPVLTMSGGGAKTLEIGGKNYGLSNSGFNGNFHLMGLSLADGAYVDLADAVNNGHRNGPGGYAEALYVESLSVPTGTTLDLNNLWLYTFLPGSGAIHAVTNGEHLFGGGDIIGSPVPLPPGLLLLGSGLLGLAVLGRRFKKS